MLQPLPPDERIDAPPPNLAWSESIRADGGRITFDGGRSPVTMGLGAILAVVATSLLILAGIRLHVWPFVLFGVVFLLLVGAAWRSHRRLSGALIDVDGARVLIDPSSRFAAAQELALDLVDYFAAQTEIQTTLDQRRRVEIEIVRWYEVHVHLKSGEKRVVAGFREREHALFVAQRLDALVERACAVRGVKRDTRPIVPVPYR